MRIKPNFLRNITKSLGQATTSAFGDMMPDVKNSINSNKIFLAQTYNEPVKDEMNLADLRNLPVYKSGEQLVKNALADLKSGEVYNKERLNKAKNQSNLDLGFDFSDTFGDMDSDISSPINNNIVINNSDSDNNGLSVLANINTATMKMSHLSSSTISRQLSSMIEFNNENTLNFYEDMSAKLGSLTENVSQMTGFMALMSEVSIGGIKHESSQSQLTDLLQLEGLDLRGITGLYTKNLDNDSNRQMFDMFIKPYIDEMVANPMGSALKLGIKTLLPKTFKSALGEFNEVFKSIPIMAQGKLQSWKGDDNDFKSTLADMFGLDLRENKRLNFSNYEKGKVEFDGITRRAIVNVIPSLLSKILSAVSGNASHQEELVYDYEIGRFTSKKKILDGRDQDIKNYTIDSYGVKTFKEQILKNSEGDFETSEELESFMSKIDESLLELIKASTIMQSNINPKDISDDDDVSKSILDNFNSMSNSQKVKLQREMLTSSKEYTNIIAGRFNMNESMQNAVDIDPLSRSFKLENNAEMIDRLGKVLKTDDNDSPTKKVFGRFFDSITDKMIGRNQDEFSNPNNLNKKNPFYWATEGLRKVTGSISDNLMSGNTVDINKDKPKKDSVSEVFKDFMGNNEHDSNARKLDREGLFAPIKDDSHLARNNALFQSNQLDRQDNAFPVEYLTRINDSIMDTNRKLNQKHGNDVIHVKVEGGYLNSILDPIKTQALSGDRNSATEQIEDFANRTKKSIVTGNNGDGTGNGGSGIKESLLDPMTGQDSGEDGGGSFLGNMATEIAGEVIGDKIGGGALKGLTKGKGLKGLLTGGKGALKGLTAGGALKSVGSLGLKGAKHVGKVGLDAVSNIAKTGGKGLKGIGGLAGKVGLGGLGGLAGKATSKLGLKGLAKGAGKLTKFIPGVGTAITAGMGIYDTIKGVQNAGETFGTDKATLGQKFASGAGGLINGLSFGLLDGQKTSKNLYSGANKLGNLFKPKEKKVGSYADGGVVDYTGKANVHGTKDKPEMVLNSDQTTGLHQFIKDLTFQKKKDREDEDALTRKGEKSSNPVVKMASWMEKIGQFISPRGLAGSFFGGILSALSGKKGGIFGKIGGFFSDLFGKIFGKDDEETSTGGSDVAIGGDLGFISEKYESGGNGVGSVGYDSTGGQSYGTYQIATKTGTMKSFLSFLEKNNPEYYKVLSKAGTPGSAGFTTAWKALASSDKEGFGEAQRAFIGESHYKPSVATIKSKTGIDVSTKSQAVQEMAWSVGVQHGSAGAGNLFANAGVTNEMSDEDIIKKVYAERKNVNKYFSSSTSAVKSSVLNRFKSEENDVLSLLKNGSGGDPGGSTLTGGGIVNTAMQFVGKLKYAFGGTNITGGSGDCSAFTQYVFKKNGIDIGRTTGDQIMKGTEIPMGSIQAGDLVFFKNTYKNSHPYGASHVGIAIGGGEMVNLASSGCKVASYTSGYWGDHYLMARRVGGSSSSSSASRKTASTSTSDTASSNVSSAYSDVWGEAEARGLGGASGATSSSTSLLGGRSSGASSSYKSIGNFAKLLSGVNGSALQGGSADVSGLGSSNGGLSTSASSGWTIGSSAINSAKNAYSNSLINNLLSGDVSNLGNSTIIPSNSTSINNAVSRLLTNNNFNNSTTTANTNASSVIANKDVMSLETNNETISYMQTLLKEIQENGKQGNETLIEILGALTAIREENVKNTSAIVNTNNIAVNGNGQTSSSSSSYSTSYSNEFSELLNGV